MKQLRKGLIPLIISLAALVFLSLAFAPAFQQSDFSALRLRCNTCTTAVPVLDVRNNRTSNAGALLTLRDSAGTPVFEVDSSGNQAGQSMFLRYQDVAAAPSIHAEATVIATVTVLDSEVLGIAAPRNAVIVYQTAAAIDATAGNITVAGVDARGNVTTEQIAVAASAGTQTLTGVVPWHAITSLTLPTRTEQVTVTVTGGQLFGLPIVPKAASDVYHVVVNLTPQAAPTVDTTYGTFNPVSTPAANVDYDVWLKQ